MKKQILSILAAAAVTSCFAVAASAAVYEQNTLVYNEAASNATTKVIDVYCAGDYTYGGAIDFKIEGVTISEYSFATADGKFDTPTVRGDWTNVEAGQVGWLIVTKSGEPECFDGAPFATLTLTVPANSAAFTVKFGPDAAIGDADYNEEPMEYDTTITIPGAAVEPPVDPEEPEPEIPVDPSETRAELVGYYDEWTDPVVAAFKTALTAEQCTRNVTWKVTDGSKTKEAKANFDRLTDIDIVIGLIVKNAPKNLVATIVVE